eukprot:1194020-Prorocentrum_minimum.AAC.1
MVLRESYYNSRLPYQEHEKDGRQHEQRTCPLQTLFRPPSGTPSDPPLTPSGPPLTRSMKKTAEITNSAGCTFFLPLYIPSGPPLDPLSPGS